MKDPECPYAKKRGYCGCHWCLRKELGPLYWLTMPHGPVPVRKRTRTKPGR